MASSTIESVYLENWEGHAKTQVEFAPEAQLTVIVGATDCGKSSIIRALRWVLCNIPQGTDYIRAGASSAAVAITYTDGCRVVRERGKSFNRYRVYTPGSAEHKLEGFGTDVPLEVSEITGVRPVSIDDLSLNLNLSEQLDAPFLGKSISAGARAKILGKLAGTEEIDVAQRALGTDLYRSNQDDKRLSAETAELTKQISAYDYLANMAERISRVEKILAGVREAEAQQNRLVTIHTRLQILQKRRNEAAEILQRWQMLGVVEPMALSLSEMVVRGGSLMRANHRLAQVAESMEQARDVISRWIGLDAARNKQASLVEQNARLLRLESLCQKQGILETGKRNASTIFCRWQGVNVASNIANSLVGSMERGQRLLRIKSRYQQVTQQIEAQQSTLGRVSGVECAAEKAEASRLAVDRYARLLTFSAKLSTVQLDMACNDFDVQARTKEIALHQQAYQDALVESGTCPVCGSTIDPNKVREVA